MKLTRPSTIIFVISLVIVALSVLAPMLGVAEISKWRLQISWIAYAVLAVGVLFRGA